VEEFTELRGLLRGRGGPSGEPADARR
jgi:hypothetical protein